MPDISGGSNLNMACFSISLHCIHIPRLVSRIHQVFTTYGYLFFFIAQCCARPLFLCNVNGLVAYGTVLVLLLVYDINVVFYAAVLWHPAAFRLTTSMLYLTC